VEIDGRFGSSDDDDWKPFRLVLAVRAGWHVNGTFVGAGLAPTSVAGVVGGVRNVRYPVGEGWDGGAGPVPVYRGRVAIEGEVERRGGGAASLEVTYQACADARSPPVAASCGCAGAMGADRLDASGLGSTTRSSCLPATASPSLPARLSTRRAGPPRSRGALFEPVGGETPAARVVRVLGANYVAAGLLVVRDRRSQLAPATRVMECGPEDEDFVYEAARFLAEIGPSTQAIHIYAPLGLGSSVDHFLTYEAAVRAFATEAGRNLFLYEEPRAFVPGA
jgi:hypothetical protein